MDSTVCYNSLLQMHHNYSIRSSLALLLEFAETAESNTVSFYVNFYCISTQNPPFQEEQTQDPQQQTQPEQQAQTGEVCVCLCVCLNAYV